MKSNFLKFMFLGYAVCFAIGDADAACYNADPKQYCLTNKRYACPPGCYCMGAKGDYGALDRKGNGKKSISKKDVEQWCKNGKTCPWTDGDGQCGASDLAKIFRCPKDFPLSDGSASSISECYFKSGYDIIYHNTKIMCNVGEYLPKNKLECVPCPAGKYCAESKKYIFNANEDQGITGTCDNNQIVNSSRSGCITKEEQKDSENTKEEQKDSENTEPAEEKIHCESGHYVKANTKKCVECSDSKKYCPGGDFYVKSKDQGIFNCPANGRANEDKSACVVTITQKQMQECWMYSGDLEKYRSCVLKR